jgi:hypothetical protein
MGRVISFPDRGAKNTTELRQSDPSEPLAANNFCCMACGVDRFLLYPSGSVQCAECGAKIDNLSVSVR